MDWSGYERSGYGLDESGYDMLEEDNLEDIEDQDQTFDEDTGVEYPKQTYSVYKRKYQLLMERMAAINQDSEIMVYRINKIKQMIKTGMEERSFLMSELDKRGDNYKGIPVVNPFQENEGKRKEAGGTSEKKTKKLKGEKEKSRDPNLPKRPQNPFFQFCKEQRDAVSKDALEKDGTQLSKKELTKLLAQKWNLLDSEQKQVYNVKFEEERMGYHVKMEDYRRRKQSEANFSAADDSVKTEDSLSMDFADF